MQIFLIRHGETASNAARVVQLPDAPLSARGSAQAERLAERLASVGAGRILASDLPRAVMTAEIVSARTGAAIELCADLQERNFGAVRGVAYADLGIDILAPDYEPPGGERWEDFHGRVARAWKAVQAAARAGVGNLAVVTHGLVCRSLALRHLSLPEGTEAPRNWRNASLTTIEAQPPWRVTLLDCVAHLDAEAHPDRSSASIA